MPLEYDNWQFFAHAVSITRCVVTAVTTHHVLCVVGEPTEDSPPQLKPGEAALRQHSTATNSLNGSDLTHLSQE